MPDFELCAFAETFSVLPSACEQSPVFMHLSLLVISCILCRFESLIYGVLSVLSCPFFLRLYTISQTPGNHLILSVPPPERVVRPMGNSVRNVALSTTGLLWHNAMIFVRHFGLANASRTMTHRGCGRVQVRLRSICGKKQVTAFSARITTV